MVVSPLFYFTKEENKILKTAEKSLQKRQLLDKSLSSSETR